VRHIIELPSRDTCMYIKPSILFLFERCVEHAYFELCQNTYVINEKFKHFTTFLRQNCITNNDAANLLQLPFYNLHYSFEIYDKNSIVDCELLTYALDNNVHDALYDKINVY